MPKLLDFTAPAGGGPLDVRRADPRAAGAFAGGIADIARAGERASREIEELDLKREQRKANLWQITTLSEDRSKWTARLKEMEDAAEEGAPGFSTRVQEEFDEYRQEAIRNAPAMVREEYEARLAAIGTDIVSRADIYEGTARAAKQVRDYTRGLNADANTLISDPTQFPDVLDLRTGILDAMDIDADKRQKLRRDAENTLAAAAVSAHVMENPKQALADLRAGEWDQYLDADKKLALIKQADTASRVGKAEARELLRDHIASIRATGVGVPGAMDAVANAYDADEVGGIQKDVRLAQDFYNVNQQILYATPEDMVATLETLKPKPGQENFADAQQTYTEAVQSAQTIMRQRADDPARFAASMPQVKQAEGDGPDAVKSAVRSNLAGQEAMGIPAPNRRVLGKGQAQAVAADIMSKPMSERAGAILQLQEQYGEYFPMVMRDLADKGFNGFGLDPRTSVLASVAGTPALSHQLATVLDTGSKELRDGLESTAVRDTEAAVRDALAPWMQTVRNGAFGSEREPMLNGIAAAVEDLAISYVRNGEDPGTAAERASDAVINDRYTLQDGYYIPNEGPDGQPYAPANIGGYLSQQQTREAIEGAGVLPFGGGDEALDRERTIRTAVESGFWVTNANATGAYLMLPFQGGGALPLRKADGSRYEFSFREASTKGTPPQPSPEMTVSP